LIQLIHDAQQRRVKLVMVYDAKLGWQSASFDVLKVFAKDNAFFELRMVRS
jgi:hypothetical protein